MIALGDPLGYEVHMGFPRLRKVADSRPYSDGIRPTWTASPREARVTQLSIGRTTCEGQVVLLTRWNLSKSAVAVGLRKALTSQACNRLAGLNEGLARDNKKWLGP